MRRAAMDDEDGYHDARSRYRDADEDIVRGRDRPERDRSSPGLFVRLYRLVRFLVFIMPLSMLLLGSFLIDCRNRSANGFLPDFIRVSACAREDLTGRLSSLEDTMRIITRAIR